VIVDTSVARNFAIAGWTDHLRDLSGGRILVAQGVLGVGPDEPGELEQALAFFKRETRRYPAGSAELARAVTAESGLADLIARRSSDLVVLVPDMAELQEAIRLQDPSLRGWRRSLGMKSRRLHSGEAVSVAIAVKRRLALACDDRDGRAAFRALGGSQCFTTLDLAKLAVARRLLSHAEARDGYERLRMEFRFFAPPW
jgi:hypothetical protein